MREHCDSPTAGVGVFTEAELESTSDKSSAVAFFLPAFGLEPPAECPGAFLLPEGLPGAILHSSSCTIQEGWWWEEGRAAIKR
jgi:hypothetical protein